MSPFLIPQEMAGALFFLKDRSINDRVIPEKKPGYFLMNFMKKFNCLRSDQVQDLVPGINLSCGVKF